MFELFLVILGGAIFYGYRHFIQDRPTDRPAIEVYAKQNGLRIVSVTRSHNYFRYFGYYFSGYMFRGIRTGGLSSFSRFYDVVVVDSEGNHASVHVVFDPFFGPRMDVLYSKGSAVVPPSGSVWPTM
jgi:hypothetical protein